MSTPRRKSFGIADTATCSMSGSSFLRNDSLGSDAAIWALMRASAVHQGGGGSTCLMIASMRRPVSLLYWSIILASGIRGGRRHLSAELLDRPGELRAQPPVDARQTFRMLCASASICFFTCGGMSSPRSTSRRLGSADGPWSASCSATSSSGSAGPSSTDSSSTVLPAEGLRDGMRRVGRLLGACLRWSPCQSSQTWFGSSSAARI